MMNEAQRPAEDRSLGELFGDLTREITTLVRQEATLARTEMSQKVARLGKDVGMPWWASALLVGVVIAGIGGALVWSGLNAIKHEDLTPRETIDSLKEDARWTNRRAA